MPRHSKAPFYTVCEDGLPIVDADGNRLCDMECSLDDDGNPAEINGYDASLFATAPELLASLKEMLGVFEEYAEDFEKGSIGKKIVRDAKKVVKKAEGGVAPLWNEEAA